MILPYCRVQKYTDLLQCAVTRKNLEKRVNYCLTVFEQIVQDLELYLSVGKSQTIIFGRFKLSRRIKIREESFKIMCIMTHLGFALASRFHSTDHLDIVMTFCIVYASSTGYHMVRYTDSGRCNRIQLNTMEGGRNKSGPITRP